MAIRFFSDTVRVLSIGLNPIQVLLIRSNPVRSGPGFVNPIRSDPVQILLTPPKNSPQTHKERGLVPSFHGPRMERLGL